MLLLLLLLFMFTSREVIFELLSTSASEVANLASISHHPKTTSSSSPSPSRAWNRSGGGLYVHAPKPLSQFLLTMRKRATKSPRAIPVTLYVLAQLVGILASYRRRRSGLAFPLFVPDNQLRFAVRVGTVLAAGTLHSALRVLAHLELGAGRDFGPRANANPPPGKRPACLFGNSNWSPLHPTHCAHSFAGNAGVVSDLGFGRECRARLVTARGETYLADRSTVRHDGVIAIHH